MKKKFLAVILTIGILGTLIGGCGDAGQTGEANTAAEDISEEDFAFTGEGLNEAKTIRIGYCAAALDSVALLEAEQKNLEQEFEKDGITVELIAFEKGAAVVEALAAGALDVSVPFGDTPTITSYANETPITVIARGKTDPSMYQLQIPADSDISSAEDLKGRRVGVAFGGGCHDYLLRVLDYAGLTEDDIELVNLSTSDNVTALETDSVDAIANSEPNASLLSSQTGAKALENIPEDLKMDLSFAVANNEFIEKNPELVARFIKVMLKTYDFVSNNAKEAAQIMADALEVDYDSVSSVERWICDPDVTDEIFDQLEQSKDFLLSQDSLSNDFDVREMYDGKYLEEAKRLYEEEQE